MGEAGGDPSGALPEVQAAEMGCSGGETQNGQAGGAAREEGLASERTDPGRGYEQGAMTRLRPGGPPACVSDCRCSELLYPHSLREIIAEHASRSRVGLEKVLGTDRDCVL